MFQTFCFNLVLILVGNKDSLHQLSKVLSSSSMTSEHSSRLASHAGKLSAQQAEFSISAHGPAPALPEFVTSALGLLRRPAQFIARSMRSLTFFFSVCRIKSLLQKIHRCILNMCDLLYTHALGRPAGPLSNSFPILSWGVGINYGRSVSALGQFVFTRHHLACMAVCVA